ncbi:MAG TPA: site-specific integrase [Bryobacteraceae bacterium]|nr:site-specific integrase [Bryobacteraceae bacterium]
MALFRPTYTDKKTGKPRQSAVWWYKFVLAGKPVRESAKTTRKTIAAAAEKQRRLDLEKNLAGVPTEKRENRIKSVASILKTYEQRYKLDHRGREQSILFSKGRLAHVNRILGSALLPDLSEDAIRAYITKRLEEGASGRTVNMEVGELSRAIGKPWSVLWPKVRKQEERKDIGKALSPEEERRLLDAVTDKKRWQVAGTIIRVALLTGMRSGEITGMRWSQVDLESRIITVGKAKTSSGTGRQIPMNDDLFAVLAAHAEWFTVKFGAARPEHYLFPFGKPQPTDPTKPTTTMKTVWNSIRTAAKVDCRLHDLRHTALTKMAEAGTPESTMLSIAGHMSRAMLERYSHIRMAAKRQAVESLGTKRKLEGVVQESVQVAKVIKVN